MAQTIPGTPESIDIAKAQARRLRSAINAGVAGQGGRAVGNCQALELMARMHGHQSWGALQAQLQAAPPARNPPMDVEGLLRKIGTDHSQIIAIEAKPGYGKSTMAAQIKRTAAGRVVDLNGYHLAMTGLPHFSWEQVSMLHIDEINAFHPDELEERLPKILKVALYRGVTVLLTGQDISPVEHMLPEGALIFTLGRPRAVHSKVS